MNFIELWLGVSPDSGTGNFELLCILSILVFLVVFVDRTLSRGLCVRKKDRRLVGVNAKNVSPVVGGTGMMLDYDGAGM
jgi:hypothetical protein